MRFLFLAVILTFSLSSLAYNCTTTADCQHGRCDLSIDTCYCDSGWVDKHSGGPCNYEQKKQLAAFLLHTFLGVFGAGEYYAGHPGYGTGQLVMTLATALGPVGKGMHDKGRKLGKPLHVIGALAGLGTAAWWIVDMVRFGQNDVDDKNGYPLKSW